MEVLLTSTIYFVIIGVILCLMEVLEAVFEVSAKYIKEEIYWAKRRKEVKKLRKMRRKSI